MTHEEQFGTSNEAELISFMSQERFRSIGESPTIRACFEPTNLMADGYLTRNNYWSSRYIRLDVYNVVHVFPLCMGIPYQYWELLSSQT
uniref:Uncharacterized protein n=1 Tax=Acrobeloides nanus TaxID=290746 RepID=A0A914E760_9BILA